MERGSDVLAFTVSYGDRAFLTDAVKELRATAGCWFDWAVFLGAPSPALRASAEALLQHPEHTGIQALLCWPENRGQHHATQAALQLARESGYTWLLRLDDDIRPKTKRWLHKMLARLTDLKKVVGDEHYRLVAAPRLIGLRNQLQPIGTLDKGQAFPVELMDILGGACRLHPMAMMEGYEPPLLDPVGRGDPDTLSSYIRTSTFGGLLVRFPDIRMIHATDKIEAQDSPEQARLRRMGQYWPYLGPGAPSPSDETPEEVAHA